MVRDSLLDPNGAAWLGGMLGSDLVDVTSDLSALDQSGRWAVAITFEGAVTCARFSRWRAGRPDAFAGLWRGPGASGYSSSLDRAGYMTAVERV